MSLLEEFPASGDVKRIIPYLPAKSLFRESFYASKKRLNEISDYCQVNICFLILVYWKLVSMKFLYSLYIIYFTSFKKTFIKIKLKRHSTKEHNKNIRNL